jgi:hypothetical protein
MSDYDLVPPAALSWPQHTEPTVSAESPGPLPFGALVRWPQVTAYSIFVERCGCWRSQLLFLMEP